MSSYQQSSPSRRNVVKGAAWAAPVIGVGVAAPSVAASIRIDPGINGWVAVTRSPKESGGGWWGNPYSCGWTVTMNSNASGSTPDGAPFGLYIYDAEDITTISLAQVTYWLPSDTTGVSWTKTGNTGSCWSAVSVGSATNKSDGISYRPYTWTYNCTINKNTVDGNGRIFLQDLNVTAKFDQAHRCNDMNIWAQRSITIDGEVLTFERRRGTGIDLPEGGARRAAPSGDGSGTSVI